MSRNLRLFLFGVCQLSLAAFASSGTYAGESCTDASGRHGTCIDYRSCPAAVEALKGSYRPKICSFNRRDPIICCAMEEEEIKPQPQALFKWKPGDKAQYWCNKYSSVCRTSRIGSYLASQPEFPHMAAVGSGPKNDIRWICAGTLVSEKFVLTSAHCDHTGESSPMKWVLLGTEVTRSATEPGSPSQRRGQIHIIVRKIIHPGYQRPSNYDDVALLEIGPALDPDALQLTSQELHPACLPVKTNDSTTNVISIGWEREKVDQCLIKVERNIVEFSACNETYGVYRRPSVLSRGIDETMICANVLGGGDNPCLISSGGPLQVPIKGTCMYEVWGISSFGILCDLRNYPHVYMRVSEYVPWIESIVWP